jgi:15-cis-phytoene desaturase
MSFIPGRSAVAPDVVVVGAGIGGLSCADLLSEAGLRVLVLEASEVPGGRARSWCDAATGHVVDIGPHVLLNKYANMLALLERLGTVSQVYWQTAELLTVLDKHRAIHVRMGRAPAPLHYLRNLPGILPSVPLPQLLSNLRLAWRTLRSNSGGVRALDGESGRHYLERMGVDSSFIDWFWASAAIALLNLPVEECSAAALMGLFAQMMGHNDVAFGIPRVGLSDLYAWPCIRALERRGSTVRFGSAVASLHFAEGRVQGVVLTDGAPIIAPVVLAVQAPAVPSLFPVAHPLAATAAHFEPSPYISCYSWFDRKLTTTPFWAMPWSPAVYNTDFYDLSNVRGDVSNSFIASNIIWSDRVSQLGDEALIAATLGEITDFAPSAQQARRLSSAVHRIPMSVPCARPGIERLRPPVEAVPGLTLAGDWVDTGLPFCMESATRAGALAAEAVLRQRGCVRKLALPAPEPGGLSKLLRRGPWHCAASNSGDFGT